MVLVHVVVDHDGSRPATEFPARLSTCRDQRSQLQDPRSPARAPSTRSPFSLSALELLIDEPIGLTRPQEGRERQVDEVGYESGELGGVLAGLVVAELELGDGDRLERQAGGVVFAGFVLVALLEEDREADVAVLDALDGAGPTA
jgi:hypothetical protein